MTGTPAPVHDRRRMIAATALTAVLVARRLQLGVQGFKSVSPARATHISTVCTAAAVVADLGISGPPIQLEVLLVSASSDWRRGARDGKHARTAR